MALTCEDLRHRLAPLAPEPAVGHAGYCARRCLPGDEGAALLGADARTPAAVLVPLVGHDGGPTVVLTRRTDHLRDHAGQISFPGGRIEDGDLDIVQAALREAEEEIGLPPALVEVVGRLPAYDTVTGFRIHPVVGWIGRVPIFRPDPHEVAEVFEVPLAFVLDARNHQRGSYERGGTVRNYYVLPYQTRRIWGATAGILVNLARMLKP